MRAGCRIGGSPEGTSSEQLVDSADTAIRTCKRFPFAQGPVCDRESLLRLTMRKRRLTTIAVGCLATVMTAVLSVSVGESAWSDVGAGSTAPTIDIPVSSSDVLVSGRAVSSGSFDQQTYQALVESQAPLADVTVSSFNVLGSSHTVHSSRWAPGTTRIRWGAELLASHGTDVVGFNELQQDQLGAFVEVTDGQYGIYPGAELLWKDSNNSIAWSKSMWELVEKRTFDIPYFDGKPRAMPIVLLRHKATGLLAHFINVHNPATNRKHPDSDRYRRRAITIEIDKVNELRQSGFPVFIMGDMNERDYVFCRMTGEAPMQAARGGTNVDGVCDAQKPPSVSWIFGSQRLGFSGYVEDRSEFVQKITDHRVLFSDVQIDGAQFPNASTAPAPVS